MGDKDIISKDLFKRLLLDVATYLLHLPIITVELVETEFQRVEDRRADLVAKVSDGQNPPFILHIEIQNQNHAQMPLRMLRYLTDILFAHPGLPVQQYLVYIGNDTLTMPDGLALPQMPYRYTLLDMHRVDCHTLLQHDSPDALVLAILCDFQHRSPREMIHTILTRLITTFRDNPSRLREYVSMLDVLASNRDINVDIQQELAMLTIEIEKLPTYQMGMEKGREEGLEEGAQAKARAIAQKLLALRMDTSQIVAITGLSPDEVVALRNSPTTET